MRGQKHVNVITSGNKTNITVLACVSANGYALPPMVIYSRKSLLHEGRLYMAYPCQGGLTVNFFIAGLISIFLNMPPKSGHYYCFLTDILLITASLPGL